MPRGQNKLDNKLDYQILVMQASVDTNKQVTDELNQDNDELKKKLKNVNLILDISRHFSNHC